MFYERPFKQRETLCIVMKNQSLRMVFIILAT